MLGKKDYWKVAMTFVIALGICVTGLVALEKPATYADMEAAREVQQILDFKASFTPQTATAVSQYPADLKANPYQGTGIEMGERTDALFEGFEGGAVPPAGWSSVVNNAYTWEVDSYNPFEGSYNATCLYDETYTGTQDEWIISGAVDLTSFTSALFEFEFNGSYYWATGTYQNYDLNVYISTDDGATWTQIWNQDDHPDWVSDDITWVWLHTTIDISSYVGQTVKVAFQYYGYDGAQFSVDAVSINDGELPTGRCCYDDPSDPLCVDGITQQDCIDTYSGSWAQGLNCTDNPCPLAPANDTWQYAQAISGPFPQTVTGTTIAATVDCPGVLDWEAVWYVFEATYDYNNIDINYCGTVPGIQEVGIVVYADPSDCGAYIIGNYEWVDCGDGQENPHIWLMGMPPGTYYLPVFTGTGVQQDFSVTVNITELIPPENDEADKAEEIGEVTDVPFSTTLATFDGPGGCQTAPNVWFCYTATTTGLASFDLCGSLYDTKMAVYEGCEVDVDGNPTGAQIGCNDDDTGTGGNGACDGKSLQSGLSVEVVSGNSYLVEVGGYSANVGDGDLTVTVIVGGVCCDPATGDCTDVADEAECTALGGNYTAGESCASFTCPPPASEGDSCEDPLKVDIPGDLPYSSTSYTCGRFNNYPKEVLCYYQEYGYGYGDGEDAIYELTVTATTTIGMTMDPQGTTWSYVEIRTDCPPTGTGCVYWFRNTGSTVYSSDPVTLDPGTYYIQVDTWPSPACIPTYTLSIADVGGTYCSASGGCDEYIENVTFGDINNTTACEGYGDFTSLSTTVVPGMGYAFSMSIGNAYTSDYGAVWVDWNQDMDFEDANEAITLDVSSGAGPYTGTITVPTDAIAGATRMRVRLSYSTPPGPCGATSYGEAEDYTVVVGGADPVLSLDPTSFAFGPVGAGATGGGVLTVGNSGGGTLDFTVAIAYSKNKDLTGSNITTTDTYVPGGTMDIDFLMFNASPDVEWIAGASITFPAGATVNSATNFVEQADPTNYLNWQGETGDGATTTWYYDDTYGIYDGEYADAAVNVTFDGGLSGDLTLDYVMDGDEWGAEPHQVTGQIILSEGGGTPEWLSIDVTGGSLGAGETTPINVTFDATGLADGTYYADLVVTHNGTKAVASVPVTLEVSSVEEPHMIIEPGTMHWSDGNLVEDEVVTVFVGGNALPFDLGDVDGGTVLVNGLTPLSVTTGTHEDMTGDVMVIELSKIAFVQGYGVIWTGDPHTYTCTGDFTGGGSFSEVGDVTLNGHIPGDVTFDGVVNILDIMAMVNSKFKGGAAIIPWQVSDVNASGGFNILDILYLIDFKFKGGPAPLHP